MKLSDLKKPQHFWRFLQHHVIRRIIWKRWICPRVNRLSANEFFRRYVDTDSIKHFQHSLQNRFFFHPLKQKDSLVTTLTTIQSYSSILEEANDVLNNRFQTLGSTKVELGKKINWQRDFKSGKEWSLSLSHTLDILDLSNPSDVKVPWELSRFHQVWWLGKAYWLTSSERYAQKFQELIEDWIDNNPVGKGVNWIVAMEVAMRAVNWIAGYYFFCESKSVKPDFWMKLFKSLYIHGLFVEHNLEYSRNNGNHFLSDVVGLIFLGIFFRNTHFGREWLCWGIKNLENEMQNQVLPDGVDFEKSTSYHRLVLELFYSAAIICKLNDIQLSQSFYARLEKMFEFVQFYTRPDGSIPLWGDADDGRLFRFSVNEEINDHRHAPAIGAVLFNRSDLKVAAGKIYQDVLFYFGEEGIKKWQLLQEEVKPLSSHAFPDGGFYILHGRNSNVFIDAGELGQRGRGGHGHNDTLSFELWIDGAPLIVDSGTYTYTSDAAARQEFRSTRAHNTIIIDRTEIAEFSGLWSVKRDETNPRVVTWQTTDEFDLLEAEHFAYCRLASPVNIRRTFIHQKKIGELTIRDNLSGNSLHQIESFLHFTPQACLSALNEHEILVERGLKKYLIHSLSGKWQILTTQYSPSYGIRIPSTGLVLNLQQTLPVTIEYSIHPQ